MKKADRSLARYALILGDDEVNNQQVTLKPMQFDTQSGAKPEQVLCSIEEAIKIMAAGKS
jgi:histidyl-tRNA synthetase